MYISCQVFPIQLTPSSYASCLFQGYNRALYAAVFSLAFHLCVQVGELTVSNGNLCNVLCCDHLTISRSDSRILKLTVTFEHYKHKRQKTSGSYTVLPTGDASCPLEHLSAYLRIRPQIPGILFFFLALVTHYAAAMSPGRCIVAYTTWALTSSVLAIMGSG